MGVVCFPAPFPCLAACGIIHENHPTKVLIIGDTLRVPPNPLRWPPLKLGGVLANKMLIADNLSPPERPCYPLL